MPADLRQLTERQRDVLLAIQRSIDDTGRSPSQLEICRAIGVRSTNGVNDHLKALERKGWITRGQKGQHGRAPTRTIVVLYRTVPVIYAPGLNHEKWLAHKRAHWT